MPAPPDPRNGTLTKPTGKPLHPETLSQEQSPTTGDYTVPVETDDTPTTIGIYVVEKLLGQGGMGAVYLAVDPGLQRKVALKVMKASFAANPVARERFVREARAAAKVESDHIIRVYQVSEDRGLPFIAMEYLKGKSMDIWMKKAQPSVKHVARIGYETALGLHAAHKAGLIHRDIKPANLWLEAPTGRIKILDFGLARPTEEETHLTNTGVVVGTPAYMSPEQGRGKELDLRTDIFSLGCVLYHLATGKRPFAGNNTYEVIASLIGDTPVPPHTLNSHIPVALSDAIMQMLEKDVAKRPAKARTVAEEMAKVLKEIDHSKVQIQLPSAQPMPMATGAGTTTVWDQLDEEEEASGVTAPGAEKPSKASKIVKVKPPRHSKIMWIIGSGVCLLFVLLAGTVLASKIFFPPKPLPDDVPPPTTPRTKPTKPVNEIEPLRPFSADGERDAAEAFAPYSQLVVRLPSGKQRIIENARDLPQAPFSLVHVKLRSPVPGDFAEKVFWPCLERLSSLEGIDDTANRIPWGSHATLNRLAATNCKGTIVSLYMHVAMTTESISALGQFPKLRKVMFAAASITDAKVALLAGLQLREIGFKQCNKEGHLTPAGYQALLAMPATYFNLENTGYTTIREIVKAIAEGSSSVNRLNLSDCDIDDSIIPELIRCTKLRELVALRTSLSAEGIAKLTAGAPACSIFWNGGVVNAAGDDSIFVRRKLSPYARMKVRLESGRELEVQSWESIPNEKLVITEIALDREGTHPTDWHKKTLLDVLPYLKHLTRLDADMGRFADDRQFLQLADSPCCGQLELLHMLGPVLSTKNIDILKRFPKLKGVSFKADNANDDALVALGNMAALEELALYGLGKSAIPGERGRSAIGRYTVNSLKLEDAIFTPQLAVRVVAMPKLTVLHLDSAVGITAETLGILSGSGQLTRLSLSQSDASDNLVDSLLKFGSLKLLNVTGTKFTEEGIRRLEKGLPKCEIAWNGGTIKPR